MRPVAVPGGCLRLRPAAGPRSAKGGGHSSGVGAHLQEVLRTHTSSCLLAAPVNIKAYLRHRNGRPLTDLRVTGAGFFDFNPRTSPTHAAAAHYASEALLQRYSNAIPCAMLAKACCASRAGQQHQAPSSRGPRAGSARQAAAANRLLWLVQSAANAGQAETLVSGVATIWCMLVIYVRCCCGPCVWHVHVPACQRQPLGNSTVRLFLCCKPMG